MTFISCISCNLGNLTIKHWLLYLVHYYIIVPQALWNPGRPLTIKGCFFFFSRHDEVLIKPWRLRGRVWKVVNGDVTRVQASQESVWWSGSSKRRHHWLGRSAVCDSTWLGVNEMSDTRCRGALKGWELECVFYLHFFYLSEIKKKRYALNTVRENESTPNDQSGSRIQQHWGIICKKHT